MNTEQLVSRTWPERRVSTERRVDIDPTCPDRRAADRRMQNTLILQAFKASERRFTGESVSGFGGLS